MKQKQRKKNDFFLSFPQNPSSGFKLVYSVKLFPSTWNNNTFVLLSTSAELPCVRLTFLKGGGLVVSRRVPLKWLPQQILNMKSITLETHGSHSRSKQRNIRNFRPSLQAKDGNLFSQADYKDEGKETFSGLLPVRKKVDFPPLTLPRLHVSLLLQRKWKLSGTVERLRKCRKRNVKGG